MTKKHELGGWGGYKACGRREGTLMWRNRVVYFYRMAQLVVVVGPAAPPPLPPSSVLGKRPRCSAATSRCCTGASFEIEARTHVGWEQAQMAG